MSHFVIGIDFHAARQVARGQSTRSLSQSLQPAGEAAREEIANADRHQQIARDRDELQVLGAARRHEHGNEYTLRVGLELGNAVYIALDQHDRGACPTSTSTAARER